MTVGTRSPRSGLALAVRSAALLGVGLFVALLAYGLLTAAPETGIDDNLAEARATPAPAFELPVLQRGDPGVTLAANQRSATADGQVALSELRGRPMVLNFWASWCVPCQQEAPLLERSWRRWRGEGVAFLGLNMQDVTEDARAFMRRYDNTYLNVRDQSNGVARKWGVTGLPETFFITRRGMVVGHVIGVVSERQLRDGVAAAQSGRPLGALDGGDRRVTR